MSTRVLYWSPHFWPYIGGLELFGAKLLPALRDRGYEFQVLTSHDNMRLPDDGDFKGIQVRRLPFLSALTNGRVGEIMRLRQEVMTLRRDFAPDIIHVNVTFGATDILHLFLKGREMARTLSTVHGEWQSPLVERSATAAHALAHSDWISFVSQAALEQAGRIMPEIRDRSSVIYNGLEPPSLTPTALPLAEPRLLCFGRLSKEKGLDIALEAIATLVDRFPSVRLIIAGDGPEKQSLESQAARLKLLNRVEFRGWVSPGEAAGLINDSTIVLMPSRYEGFGLVAVEAALMARPVIAARAGGLSEVIAHERTGLLVEREDIGGLSRAIEFLLEHPGVATKMGQEARARSLQLFDFESFVDAYDALYRRLTEYQAVREPVAGLPG
jgi:glycogen(starch) synthase